MTPDPEAIAAPSPWKPTIVDKVPEYTMRTCPHKPDESDEKKNKADAALFQASAPLKADRQNWAYQRMFVEFKQAGTENDPFEDGKDKDADVWANTLLFGLVPESPTSTVTLRVWLRISNSSAPPPSAVCLACTTASAAPSRLLP